MISIFIFGRIYEHNYNYIFFRQIKSILFPLHQINSKPFLTGQIESTGISGLKSSKKESKSDFYQNINLISQLISPLIWLLLYIPALKTNIVYKSKIFISTKIGNIYKSYIDLFKPETHQINFGILLGIHFAMAVTAIRLSEFKVKFTYCRRLLKAEKCLNLNQGLKSTFLKAMWFVQTFIHGPWSLLELYNHQRRDRNSEAKPEVAATKPETKLKKT